MNPSTINLKPKSHGGGGLWGKIAGGVLGLAAAPFTGGMSIPAALGTVGTAMGIGSTIGGLAGSAIDPGKVTGGKGPTPLENAMKTDLDAKVATLNNSMKLIDEDPNMDGPTKDSLRNPISEAITRLTRR